jgi:general secretion pathway protein A
MYLKFYGLQEEPFGATPDPRFLYLSPKYREAQATLEYGVRTARGFTAVVAKPGMGKTTLLFNLLEHFSSSARTAFLFQTQCDSREFMRYLLSELGIDIRNADFVHLQDEFNRLLIRESRAGKQFIVVVDEAQNLSAAVLETVRLLSDFETPRKKLMHVILAGQPELGDKLASAELEQLRQRISHVVRLEGFSLSDVEAYVNHRLEVAGYSGEKIFSADAIRALWERSDGTPRIINNLCFNSLSLGYALGRKAIDAVMVREVSTDLDFDTLAREVRPTPVRMKMPPLQWKRPASSVQTGEQRAVAAIGSTRNSSLAEPIADSFPEQIAVPEDGEIGVIENVSADVLPDLTSPILLDEGLGYEPLVESRFTFQTDEADEAEYASARATDVPAADLSPDLSAEYGDQDFGAPLSDNATTAAESDFPTDREMPILSAPQEDAVATGINLQELASEYALLHMQQPKKVVPPRRAPDDDPLPQPAPAPKVLEPVTVPAEIQPKAAPAATLSTVWQGWSPRTRKCVITAGFLVALLLSWQITKSLPGRGQMEDGTTAEQTAGDPASADQVAAGEQEAPVTESKNHEGASAGSKVVVTVTDQAFGQGLGKRGSASSQHLDISQDSGTQLLHTVEPVYPPAAKLAGLQGAVVISALIAADGSVRHLRVLRGDPLLAQAATEAVKNWQYRPPVVNGQAVESPTQITVKFMLADNRDVAPGKRSAK